MLKTSSDLINKIGIALSSLCLVHCLLLPLVLLIFPFVEDYQPEFLHGHFHELIFLPILLVSGLAFIPPYLKNRKKRLIILPGIGISLLVIESTTHLLGEITPTVETVIKLFASTLLIYSHLFNIKHSSCCLEHSDNPKHL